MTARLRSKISVRALVTLCAAAGVDTDEVLRSSGTALAEVQAGPKVATALLDTGLFAVTTTRTETVADVVALSRALLAAAASDVEAAVDTAERMMLPVYERFGVPSGGGSGSVLRAVGSLDFGAYLTALDAPLADVLTYFALGAVHAANAEANRAAHRAMHR